MNRYFVLSAASFVALCLLPDQRTPFLQLSGYLQAAYLACVFGIVMFGLFGVAVQESRKAAKASKLAPQIATPPQPEPINNPSSVLWRIFQGGVILAIVASNIQWQWTPNPYLAFVIGLIVVLLISGFAAKWSDKRAGLPTVPPLNPLGQFRRSK